MERSCTSWSKGVFREERREDQVSSHADAGPMSDGSIMQPRISRDETRLVYFSLFLSAVISILPPNPTFLGFRGIFKGSIMSCARRLKATKG